MRKEIIDRWLAGFLITTGLLPISGCQQKSDAAIKIEPAKVERLDDELSRLILTPRAAERLGIKTETVREVAIPPRDPRRHLVLRPDSTPPGTQPDTALLAATSTGSEVVRKVVPYTSVLYDLKGDTWVYTNPKPLVFVRDRITVEYIDGDRAVLSAGPDADTKVVTVGVAELYGTEFKVGH